MQEPAENPRESAAPGRPFQPGQSGNPGGRPKGLASAVRRNISEDELVAFWQACLTGILETTVYEHDEWHRDKAGRLRKRHVKEHTIRETVEMKDRIAISKILAERGWGKPPQFMPIDDPDPLDFQNREADELAGEFDSKLGDLEKKRQEREERERAAQLPDG
jgi:hypothetical protein